MAQIGDSQTSRFFISQAEVRLYPMNQAMKGLPTHSIGLLNSATVNFSTESVDLKAGLPRKIYDTQIVEQLGTISMDMREYSRRNMQFLLGYSPEDYVAQTSSTLAIDADSGTGSVTVAVGDGAKFTKRNGSVAGSLVCIYPADPVRQGEMTYAEVTNIVGDVLTLGPVSNCLLFDYKAGDLIFDVEPLAIGANSSTSYFGAQVLGISRTGQPVGFTFWRVASSSGLGIGFQADDFNTNPGELKILSPSSADLAVGGDLYDVRTLVASYPQGMAQFGGDVTA